MVGAARALVIEKKGRHGWPDLPLDYFALSKAAAVGPATATVFWAALSLGCHTFTV